MVVFACRVAVAAAAPSCMHSDSLLRALGMPRPSLQQHHAMTEVVLDVGKIPLARYADGSSTFLGSQRISKDDIYTITHKLPTFDAENRTGVEGTLHRISVLRDRQGSAIGLTCRVGRPPPRNFLPEGVVSLLHSGRSVLFVGKPGSGKTTALRNAAKVLSEEMNVMVVDSSAEIGGYGVEVDPKVLGNSRRMHVPRGESQGHAMIECVQNHTPQVIIVDEIADHAEASACRSVAERGVQLIATAHGSTLESVLQNPMLSDVVGGVASVTMGDALATSRGLPRKTVLERKHRPTFPFVVEVCRSEFFVVRETAKDVDTMLKKM